MFKTNMAIGIMVIVILVIVIITVIFTVFAKQEYEVKTDEKGQTLGFVKKGFFPKKNK